MSDNTTNKNVRNDEIDLLDLFKRIGNTLNNWIVAIGKALFFSIVFFIRRWLSLGISILLGLGVSLLISIESPPFYTSDMMLSSNDGSSSELISHVNRLHNYCMELNIEALKEALSISTESANNIVDISAHWIVDINLDGVADYIDYKNYHNIFSSSIDTVDTGVRSRFDIRVLLKNPQEFFTIRNKIIKFIENNSYFQYRNQLVEKHRQELVNRLDYDIIQLDSLQKVKYFEETRKLQPQSGSQLIFMQEQKTQLLYNDIYALYERKQRIEYDWVIFKGIVTVLSDFSIPVNQTNNFMYYAKKIVPLFFALAIIILILIANRKKLQEVYKKY